jgi:hypothetical protein
MDHGYTNFQGHRQLLSWGQAESVTPTPGVCVPTLARCSEGDRALDRADLGL